MPIRISWAIQIKACRLMASITGIGGKVGIITTQIARARYRRTRAETSWVPMIGININSAEMRNSGSRKLPTQAPICSLLSSSMSADQHRNIHDQVLGVLHQLSHQPGTGKNQHQQNDQQPG